MDEVFIRHVDDCDSVLSDFYISCYYTICGQVSKKISGKKINRNFDLGTIRGSIAEHSPQRTSGNSRHLMSHDCILIIISQSDKRNQPFRSCAVGIL